MGEKRGYRLASAIAAEAKVLRTEKKCRRWGHWYKSRSRVNSFFKTSPNDLTDQIHGCTVHYEKKVLKMPSSASRTYSN
jgi:hypothetical protein